MSAAKSALAILVLATAIAAQSSSHADGPPRSAAADPRVMLEFAQFDPLVGAPEVPALLAAADDVHLFVVQFRRTPNDADRAAVRAAGGEIAGYLPHDCHLVRCENGTAAIAELPQVRWLGAYQPAYRLGASLQRELLALPYGGTMPTRAYDLVMTDKRRDKASLAARLRALGAEVLDRHPGGLLFTARLSPEQLALAARLDEVLWIDPRQPRGTDMNNARVQGGADALMTITGYTGNHVAGHVFEGRQFNHPDLFYAPSVFSGPDPDQHGHCMAGILFGQGNTNPNARGLVPGAVSSWTNPDTMTAGVSRNQVIATVSTTYQSSYTVAGWGMGHTGTYSAVSADADDIVFEHRLPWFNSMGNEGTATQVRPEAWAKNVISVGGVWHGDNANAADDSWNWPGPGPAPSSNASIGLADDNRTKPDLVAYYDKVLTSDLSAGVSNGVGVPGTGGFGPGDWTDAFGGTSAAAAIVAGYGHLTTLMFTDALFGNPLRTLSNHRHDNRPYPATMKALMIASARMYAPTATNNRREQVGWGFPNVIDLYDNRDLVAIVGEDAPLTDGTTHNYSFEVLPGQSSLKFCMSYVDPAGNPAAAFDRVNDLDMRVQAPDGTWYWGNFGLKGNTHANVSAPGGSRDTRDTVECAMFANPQPGVWTVRIAGTTIVTDAHPATPETDATYALVVFGARQRFGSDCARYVPDHLPTGGPGNSIPWGQTLRNSVETVFDGAGGVTAGGTLYFDFAPLNDSWVQQLVVNANAPAGTELHLDLFTTPMGVSYVGKENTPGTWTARSAGRGVAAGPGNQTVIDLAEPFLLNAGSYGFAVTSAGWAHVYGIGAHQTFSNPWGTISGGSATPGLFSGQVFTPRVPNVAVRLVRDDSFGANARYQTVVRSSRLKAGTITGLAFAARQNGRHFNRGLTVRMAHVPPGHTLSTTFAANLPNSIAVLAASNHSWWFEKDQWSEIGLTKPFVYDGVSDLVIEVIARGNATFGDDPDVLASAFHSGNEPRVLAASWSPGQLPTTASFDDNHALRMRVSYECAYGSEHGASCGRLDSGHDGDGSRGNVFTFRCSNALPNNLAFLGLGLNASTPYPIPLTVLGWTNCSAYHDFLQIGTNLTDGAGGANSPFPVPDDPSLDGAMLYGQWFQFDPSEPGSLTLSGMTRMIVGVSE